ncbi:hypothetical protein BU23DRAFT_14694 [Bimuria novae-zelandiae CBS 107.79]|uniref:Uncharacterized protein n=1 Tax=Bimuria novae-zelandiae CBS 107.79 TaxID=1447943 RepID=A0A6A5VKB6_9PLEO|nr:hypothetical protein BU23DRAFT_14694 [Bimuria novae-zelandiae CBS 107.79]
MAFQRDITVGPDTVDFAALTRPTAPTSLVARATSSETTRRIWIITGISILVSLVVMGIFCCVVLYLMHRTKEKRKKRTLDLGLLNPNRGYCPVNDMELQYEGAQELPADHNFSGYNVELPAGAHEVPKVQQLDGYVAPPKPSAHPAELASNMHTQNKVDYR